MPELRREFRTLLAGLEDGLLTAGRRCQELLALGIAALHDGDPVRCEQVLRGGDQVTADLREIDEGLFRALALQAPVAGELRQVSAFIHTGVHLSRIAQLCRNLAKTAADLAGTPGDDQLEALVADMGAYAGRQVGRALEALARRDAELAGRLHDLDDPIDQLNAAIFRRCVEYAAGSEDLLDRAMRMVLVARYLERIGDHAVLIGDRVVFAVTGE